MRKIYVEVKKVGLKEESKRLFKKIKNDLKVIGIDIVKGLKWIKKSLDVGKTISLSFITVLIVIYNLGIM